MLNKKKLIFLIVSTVAVLTVFITLIVLIVGLSRQKATTYKANETQITITNNFNGVINQNVTPIPYEYKDKIVYEVYEGDIVEKTDIIAYRFPNASVNEIENVQKINDEIYILKQAKKYSNLSLSEIEFEINETNIALSNYGNGKNNHLYDVNTIKLKALTYIRTNLLSNNEDIDASIETKLLVKKSKMLELGIKVPIVSPSSGIFTNYYDVHEFSEAAKSIGIASTSSSLIVVSDYDNALGYVTRTDLTVYHIECTDELSKEYKVGEKYSISFPQLGDDTYECSLISSYKNSKNGKMHLSFSIVQNNTYIGYGQKNAIISQKTINGIAISQKDVYTIRGNTCVYVLDDSGKARIRQVNIIYTSGTTCVSSLKIENPTYTILSPGEYIISGEYRIYDGKVIK